MEVKMKKIAWIVKLFLLLFLLPEDVLSEKERKEMAIR